jgi:DIS3-like exonuclease 2
MEGDFVAITLDPTSSWPRLKGSLNKQANSESSASKQGAMESGKTINIDAHSSQEIVVDHTEAQFQDIDAGANARVLHEGEMTLEAHHQHFVQDTANSNQMHMKQETHVLPIEVSCDDSSQAFEKHTEGSSNTVIQILKLQGSGLTPVVDLQSLAQSNVEKEEGSHPRPGKVATAITSLALLVMSCPGRRPTGKVVAILEKSPRRESVVGFLEALQHSGNKPSRRGQQENHSQRKRSLGTMLLVPVDNRYPKMLVFSACLPDDLYERLKEGDATMLTELVAAQVDEWHSDSHLPNAVVKRSLGQGGQIEAQLKAILFEHGVDSAAFSQESLDCLPKIPWKISPREIKRRVDLRGQRIFSIDPPTAKDLDDALSFECLENGVVRVGVHIADVSYFVSPNTALDKEAQSRSTSVYLEQQVVPMLPHLLCEELCSLNPGVDRLAFSIIWSISPTGDILDQWIGKTVIQSCVKLTYGHAQNMIDGVSTDLEEVQAPRDMQETESSLPKVHGKHTWQEVVADVQALYNVAKKLRDGRFEKGALKLNNSKLMFSLDEDGAPYESTMFKTKDSNFVVEEFMLLANMSVARVISDAFPDSALLRRHPEPNMRKLKEFEDFCDKNGFELNASSSGALHISLEKMQERFKHDPAVFNILMLLATKPMQLAKYFCTGELKDKEEEWSHYALATPLYTHFTSPIRRYPDILVHRMLAAALEAEEVIIQGESSLPSSRGKSSQALSLGQSNQLAGKCFSGAKATKEATFMPSAQQALASAAIKHKLPGIADLAVIATHCNERKLASRNVKDASDKLYLWTMLKKKQGLLSDARVLALGSKFMSLYICKVAMERRIYYEEIEGVNAEWFAATGTLVLDISPPTVPKKWSNDSKPGRQQRTVADIATVVNPTDSIGSSPEEESYEDIIREVEERLAGKIYTDDISANVFLGENHLSSEVKVEPAVLPLTLRLFSMVPVSLHAAGGGNQPLEITVKLYISSYATA